MYRLLLIGIIICMAAMQGLCQVKETVLKENFANNQAGWPEDKTDEFMSEISNGYYHLVHSRTYGSKCFDIPVKMYLGDNYFLETEGKLLSGDRHNGYGIVWGKGKGGYFTFVATADGKFYVRKVYTGKQGEYLIDPTPSRFINKGGITNRLRVQYCKNELQFYINNQYVGHLPREQYFGNNAGIVLYGRQTVNIDYFGAYGTKNYERLPNYNAKMTLSYYEIEDGHDEVGNILGNGNCRVEAGETIMLNITLKNTGFGKCENLIAKTYAISDYVTILDQKEGFNIATVDRFQTVRIPLKFRVSKSCNIEKLNFKIDLADKNGRLAETVAMTVPTNTKIPPINKDEQGKLSFTVNVRETNNDDINTSLPITLQNSQHACAVVVGVENYMSNLPKAKYASNDAKIFFSYLVKVCNMSRSSIIYLTNQNATQNRLKDVLKYGGDLYTKDKHETIIFYFSGLGLCENGKTTPYIMLYDSKEDSPQTTGISVESILKQIRAIGARQVICIFETSFAGVDRDGKSFGNKGGTLWANASFPVITDNSTCMLYASGGEQCNPTMDYTSHGMFTHFLLTSINHNARNSNTLNMKTLYDFIYQSMDREAMKSGSNYFPRMDCLNKEGIKILK